MLDMRKFIRGIISPGSRIEPNGHRNMNKTLDYIRAELLQPGMVHVQNKREFTITNASISGHFVRIEAINEAGDTCYYSHYWADEVAIIDTCTNLPLA